MNLVKLQDTNELSERELRKQSHLSLHQEE